MWGRILGYLPRVLPLILEGAYRVYEWYRKRKERAKRKLNLGRSKRGAGVPDDGGDSGVTTVEPDLTRGEGGTGSRQDAPGEKGVSGE